MKRGWFITLGLTLVASSGIGLWQLQISLRDATRTALAVGQSLQVPNLDDPARIRRGAAHYDLVCARCHASPTHPGLGEHLAFSPPAPRLHARIDGWLPEYLFPIVKHGISGTAMPAWPVPDRDDEVWAVVAFLVVLPGLATDEYRRLTGQDAAMDGAEPMVARCSRCHGVDGRGEADQAFPRLDIQHPDYLRDALTAFRDRRRASGFMQAATTGLTDANITALAAHFGQRPVQSVQAEKPGSLAVCAACHGPPAPARTAFPALAGQHGRYLATQLDLFLREDSTRGGGMFLDLMAKATHLIDPDDVATIAEWYENAGH